MTEDAVKPSQDTPALREEIIRACLLFSDCGFFIGTWGNISVRLENGLLITPSRLAYPLLRPDDLAVVSWEGRRLSGRRLPSSEMHLHRLILVRRPDLGALVHAHSPYASAVACARRTIPVCVEDMAQIIGGEVRCAAYAPGGRHQDLAGAACEAMGEESTAVLLANHGPVVGGRDLEEAVVAARVLEKAAMLFVHATSLGGCTSIPPEAVREERHRFLYKYGREEDMGDAAPPSPGA